MKFDKIENFKNICHINILKIELNVEINSSEIEIFMRYKYIQ